MSDYWQKFARERRSRRRFLGGATGVAAGAAGLALVGCAPAEDPAQPTPPANGVAPTPAHEQPKRGGTLRLAMGGEPRSLDPHFDTFPFATAVLNNTYDALLTFTPDLTKIEPELATGLPEQPDNLTYTVKLRQGVKFQNLDPVNGREFVAADVKYTIERMSTPEPGRFMRAYFFRDRIERIETPDNHTVTFKMRRPYAPTLSYLASPWSVMIPREVGDKDGDFTKRAIGTGPFILKSWERAVRFELDRNPDYWDKGLPHLDKLILPIVPDADTASTMFIRREVDGVILGRAQRERTRSGRPDANYVAVPSQFWRVFRMPPTGPDRPYQPPFNDIRFREAVVRAIDSQQVLDLVLDGDGVLTHGPILPIYTQWALKEELVPFDLQKARALMAQAGIQSYTGECIWVTGPEADQISEVLKQQLAKINVTLDLKPMELAAYYNKIYQWVYTFAHHVPLNNPDPDENLAAYFGEHSTFYRHYNRAIWDIIHRQSMELDVERRRELVLEAQRMIVLDFPHRFMFTPNQHRFIDPKVKGWTYPIDLYNGRRKTAWIDA
jgi:peptide/nickel transport system substrate-binding protein